MTLQKLTQNELDETYKLNSSGSSVQRLSDGANIPFDERNGDYRRYLAWCAAGKTPTASELYYPEPETPVIDQAVALLLRLSKPSIQSDKDLKEDLLTKLERSDKNG